MSRPTRDSTKAVVLAGLLVYLAAQIFQRALAWLGPPAPEDPIAAAAWMLTPAQLTRRAAILFSMFGLAVCFNLLCEVRARTHPFLARTARVFLLMFCFLELSYRSVELFTAQLNWAQEIVDTSDEDRRSELLARLDTFGDVVEGAYFPLLATQLVGSVCLLLTVQRRASADRYLGASMAVNVVRLAGRLSAGYLHVIGLAAFNGPLYFPLITVTLILLIVYCYVEDWRPCRSSTA